jgi:hypothetical protein
MNYLYIGKPSDDNVGNGKTVSLVGAVIDLWLEDEDKTIFSNIKLKDIPYTRFTPDNIEEVLGTSDALVILDEIHAIVHKNHKISEHCPKHSIDGLCYRLGQFFRQIRKKGSDSFSSSQTFADTAFQYRTLMQRQIVCEKYNLQGLRLLKCERDRCPDNHEHYIKQLLFKNYNFVKELPLFDPTPYYNYYDSFEIVDGWVTYE